MIADLSIEDFTAVTDVHFKGGFFLAKAAMPHMIAGGYGRVVLTASCSGLYGSQMTVNYGMSKAGLMGLNNVIALEGGEHGIQSNTIIPAAVTRMADGLDTSSYPPLEPELVAPMVAWLAHESCPVSGEHYVAGGGRMARAWTTESKGAWRASWTPEDIAADIGAIRDPVGEQWTFPPYPSGMMDHLGQTFAWAHAERAKP
jgi:NAD(P)-dependent dehydrogenase (short-subunit alcohol dehydrogenase family)